MAKLTDRSTPELQPLARAHQRMLFGEPMDSADKQVILHVIGLVLGNINPCPFYYAQVAATSRHRNYVCMAFLTHPDAETHEKKARGAVGDAWGLRERTVREIVDELRGFIQPLIEKVDADRLRPIIEGERLRYLADHSAE